MMLYIHGQSMCGRKNITGTLYCDFMIKLYTYLLFSLLVYTGLNCNSQVTKNFTGKERLIIASAITLPGVSGRIDHISYDSVNHLAFIAALGNNTVEVVNTYAKSVVHTITGLHEPQGIAYIPLQKRIAVANGNGD